MRFAWFKTGIFAALILSAAAAGAQLNPHTNVRWPAACGTGPGMVYNSQTNTCINMNAISPSTQLTWPAACGTGPGMVYNSQTNTCINVNAISPATQITWPANCTAGTVYSPPAQQCIANGTAANPAGTAGQMQYNLGGGVFGAIAGSTADSSGNVTFAAALKAKGIAGSLYASQYGNQTTNGIATAFLSGNTVIADPTYPQTENYSSANGTVAHTPAGTLSHMFDFRGGQQTDYYMDPGINAMPFNNWHTGHTDVCSYTTPGAAYTGATGSASARYGMSCNLELGWYSGPGVQLGNPPVGPQGWHIPALHQFQLISNTPGISEVLEMVHTKAGTGDNSAHYAYSHCYGGATALSDEGCEGFSANTGEATTTFKGTVATVTDEQHFKVTCTSDCGLQGDGRYITKTTPVLSSFITAHTAPSGTTPGNFTINDAVTPSTFWGTLSAPVVTPVTATITTPTPMTFTVASGPGNTGAPVAGDLVCLASQYHEQARITSVSGTGPWTLVVPLRHAHASGSWVMANGPCGGFIDFTANHASVNTLKYPVDILGATDSTHLQYSFFQKSGSITFPLGNVVILQQAITSLTNVAGLVSFLGVGQNNPYFFNTATVTISGASDSAFNGACTNTFTRAVTNTLYCTQASSIGHVAAGVTATLTLGTTGSGNGNFDLLVGAEVLDVQNYTTSPPIVDGTFLVEPNAMSLSVGNTMEQHHHYATSFTHEHGLQEVYAPNATQTNSGRSLQFLGSGVIGGNYLSQSQGMADLFTNSNPFSMYGLNGGTQYPFGGLFFSGPWNYMASMLNAPIGINQPLIYVGCPGTPGGCNDYSAAYYPFMLAGQANTSGAAMGMLARPASNEITAFGNWVFNSRLGQTTFSDNITGAIPTAPTPTFTQSAANGTLPAGTYCYRIAIRNTAGGPGIPGTEACSTFASGTTNSLLVKWTRVPGATFYYVYGRTTGAELQLAAINGTDTIYFLDDNSITPSGAMPTTDATLPILDNFQALNLNSSLTAFKATLKPPASVAGSYTLTLPAVTGTLALNTAFVASGASHAAGLVPDPGASAGTTKFLREDSTWAVPIVSTRYSGISITPAAVTASSCAEQTFNTYTGLATGQGVYVSPPATPGAHVWIGGTRVSATNTLAITFCGDATSGTPAAGVYIAVAF